MTGFIESHRVVVYPGYYDDQGHMTTMHDVAMFDAAFRNSTSGKAATDPSHSGDGAKAGRHHMKSAVSPERWL